MIAGLIGFILGTVLGSFVKAFSDRIILGESVRGRSYCLHCQKVLRWYDLFPVFSYLFLKGKCRYCHKKIPLEHLLVEVVMGVLVGLLFWQSVTNLQFSIYNFQQIFDLQFFSFVLDITFKTFFITILAIVFLIDLKTGLIPDKITYPAITFTLIYFLISFGLQSYLFYQSLLENPLWKYLLPPHSNYFIENIQRIWIQFGWNLLAAIGVSCFFALLIIITRGRGMGWGDVKYVFFLGFVLGFPNIIVAVMLAFFIGAMFSLMLIMVGKKHFGQTIPFGPFLSLGAVIALFLGTQIINWYLNNFRS